MIQASYLYEINRKGVVRNIKTKKILKWNRIKKYKGYKLTVVKQNEKRIRLCVMFHRLLMLTFFPVPHPDGMDVEHIKDEVDSDGFKRNDLNNMKWMTQKEHRGQKRKRFIAQNGRKKPVEQYDLVTGKTLQTYDSVGDAQRATGIGRNIYAVCRGSSHTAGGYGWRYTQAFLKSQQIKQGEIWEQYYNKQISNFGRVKAAKGIVSYGHRQTGTGTSHYRGFGYYDNDHNPHEKRVHQVVLQLFGQDKIKAFEEKFPGLTWTPDHIDGNGEHNCIANLRPASRSQQMKNRYHSKPPTCRFCSFSAINFIRKHRPKRNGYVYENKHHRWTVRGPSPRLKYIGSYATEEDARGALANYREAHPDEFTYK